MLSNILEDFKLMISVVAAIIAYLVYRISQKGLWAQSLFKIADRLENEAMREIRKNHIYKYNPHEPTDEEKINSWGAEMDMLSLLYFSRQLDKDKFFDMYGDVIIRSAYKLAGYGNVQREKRGKQFWLPFQKLSIDLFKRWILRVKHNDYPEKIGFPETPEKITLETLASDNDFKDFILANKARIPRVVKNLMKYSPSS